MSLTQRRYRRWWLLFGGFTLLCLLLGRTSIVSYTLGIPLDQTISTDTDFIIEDDMTIPENRQGHPREELFQEPIEEDE